MGNFRVGLKKVVDDSYDIEIGYRLEEKLVYDIKNSLVGNLHKFAIVTDDVVKDLHAEKICRLLQEEGYTAQVFVFPNGEKSKVRKVKENIEDAMLEAGFRRDCCMIAVGGGVVTDLAGFTAGTYGRGIPFINYATTLLAAADASIGGKTAVDTPLATNLIGIFNQPKKVYIDIAAWKTLPKRQLISGLAETIKHACLADKAFFDYLDAHIQEVFDFNNEVLTHIAEENCKIKYDVVMKDEKEANLREVLNLGHTVGRAIETVSDYKLLHGEAIGIGLAAEVRLGNQYGYISEEEKNRVIALLKKAGLPTEIPDYINREDLVRKLYTDKKVRDGKLRFVFQKGIGAVMEFENENYARLVPEEDARKVIMSM